MPPANAHPILRHVPNTLTVLRLLLAFLFPASPHSWRPAIVLTALATEYLDGALSRRFALQSRFGRLLDPVADKLFFASVAFTFLAEGRISLVQLALLAVRDIGVLVALAWLAARRQWKRIANLGPGLAGKLTTVLQYGALLSLLFRETLSPALVAVTAVAGAAAIVQYFRMLHRSVNRAESAS
ncbi:MAG TPA: CDP-alcohol phosphatidyltransferase family protein [Planctomycetota bacterium]|nr:CDP-alcohol phosphatidyltransferase family protein [Planctomycetota bacterium]